MIGHGIFSGDLSVLNDGLISALDGDIYTKAAADIVRKTGTITGDLLTGNDDDLAADTVSDRIHDFVRSADVIDLSAIDDTLAFTFLGTGAFTGGGDMELRYILSGGDALVVFDSDGNGFSDGRFWVNDQTLLEAGDFIL